MQLGFNQVGAGQSLDPTRSGLLVKVSRAAVRCPVEEQVRSCGLGDAPASVPERPNGPAIGPGPQVAGPGLRPAVGRGGELEAKMTGRPHEESAKHVRPHLLSPLFACRELLPAESPGSALRRGKFTFTAMTAGSRPEGLRTGTLQPPVPGGCSDSPGAASVRFPTEQRMGLWLAAMLALGRPALPAG
jgi:hypothetical protein